MGTLALTFYLLILAMFAFGGVVDSLLGLFVTACVFAIGLVAVIAAAEMVRLPRRAPRHEEHHGHV